MSRHLKTYPAPRYWPVKIKENTFTIRPASGPHPLALSIPLGMVIRDSLGYAKTVSEAKSILSEGKVLVDGVVRKNYKLPIGLMDVLYLKPADTYYRIMPDRLKKLALMKVSSEQASFKLVRIIGKRTLADKKVQLNTHDGRSIDMKVEDPFDIKMDYHLYDVLKIAIPGGEILERIPLEADAYVAIIGGAHIGKYGTLVETPENRGPQRLAKVAINGAESTVTLKYLFPIGKGSPIINTSEVA
jgi:small subunit ribosomal protein S4e